MKMRDLELVFWIIALGFGVAGFIYIYDEPFNMMFGCMIVSILMAIGCRKIARLYE